jgi:hypothetical protein
MGGRGACNFLEGGERRLWEIRRSSATVVLIIGVIYYKNINRLVYTLFYTQYTNHNAPGHAPERAPEFITFLARTRSVSIGGPLWGLHLPEAFLHQTVFQKIWYNNEKTRSGAHTSSFPDLWIKNCTTR